MHARWAGTIGGALLVFACMTCAQGESFISTGGAAPETSSSASSSHAASSGSAGGASGSGGAGGMAAVTSASASVASSAASSAGCPESPCKLVAPQCGCPPGDACTFAGTTMRSCQTAGSTPAGQGCTGQGQCAPGTICLGGGTAGVCTAFCDTDSDCTATNGICVLKLSDGTAMGSIPNETLCSTQCDITTNAGCSASGTGCQIGVEQTGLMRTFTFCTSTGTVGKNQPCTAVTDCLPGFDCINNGTQTVCLQYCYVNNPSCAQCGALNNSTTMMPIFIGSNQVGVCE